MSSEFQNQMVHLLDQGLKRKLRTKLILLAFISSLLTTPDASNQDNSVLAGRNLDSAGLPRERVIEMEE